MSEKTDKEDKRKAYRLALSVIVALILVPAVIALGVAVWDDRKFYIVSLIIIIMSMVPFALRFESRKLRARELVVLAAMIAIGVASRAAFYMTPQFKPAVAVAIITGVAFGCESGFIAGAMIAFVSNFIFGQGSWTPWQMEAMGILGFLGGILFHKRDGSLPKLLPLCVFGGLGTLIIYGLIVDTSTVITTQSVITWEKLTAKYVSGFGPNIVHAAATVIFLLILAKPLLGKLNRVRVKYGLLE